MGDDEPTPTNGDDENDEQITDQPSPGLDDDAETVGADPDEAGKSSDRDPVEPMGGVPWDYAEYRRREERREREEEAARQAAAREAAARDEAHNRAAWEKDRDERLEASAEAGRRRRFLNVGVLAPFSGAVILGLAAAGLFLVLSGGEDSTETVDNGAVPTPDAQTQEPSEAPTDAPGDEVSGADAASSQADDAPQTDPGQATGDETAQAQAAEPDLLQIGQIRISEANSLNTRGNSFTAFYTMLFIPTDVIATLNFLEQQEEIIEAAKESLTDATGGEAVSGVEIQQFSEDPDTNTGAIGQASFGVAVQLDPFHFWMAGGGSDESTYAEVNFFELMLCDPFPDCDGSTLTGTQIGGPVGLDWAQGFSDVIRIHQDGLSTVPDNYGFASSVTGDVTHVPPPPDITAAGPSEIATLQSGFVPDGQMAVKVGLVDPIPPGGDGNFIKSYQLAVRGADGSLYSGNWGFLDGGIASFGFCLHEGCPPDGTWAGFNAIPNEEGTEIVFTFDPIPGELTVNADVLTVATDAENSPSTLSPFQNGEPLPFGNSEILC